jgi:hypothetical protein
VFVPTQGARPRWDPKPSTGVEKVVCIAVIVDYNSKWTADAWGIRTEARLEMPGRQLPLQKERAAVAKAVYRAWTGHRAGIGEDPNAETAMAVWVKGHGSAAGAAAWALLMCEQTQVYHSSQHNQRLKQKEA